MARPATGSPRWSAREQCWIARIAINGKREPAMLDGVPPCLVVPNAPPPKCECASCAQARRVAQKASDKARKEGRVPASTAETVNEWFGRYYKAAARGDVGKKNEGRPQSSVEDRRSRFAHWISPHIGTLPMARVTATDLRRLVQRLDDAIRVRREFYAGKRGRDDKTGRKPGLSPKTAQHVWSEVTSGFREAASSKLDDLRVTIKDERTGERVPIPDPTRDGVQPPNGGGDRDQAALFPSEVVKLLSCADIPVERRAVYACAIYIGARLSELARVRAGDVDFAHGLIAIRGTKTAAARRKVPIEPAIRPLLEALVADEDDDALLLDVPRSDGRGGAADLVQRDLARAQIDRRELFADDAEHMPFTFHGLRHTAITHWAVAGRSQLFLLTAAGHTSVEMTKRYFAAAESLSAGFGTPHPPVPELAGELARAKTERAKVRKSLGNSAIPAGIEGTKKRQQSSSDPAARDHQPIAAGIEKTAADAPGAERAEITSAPSWDATVPDDSPRPIAKPKEAKPAALLAELVASLVAAGEIAKAKAMLAAYEAKEKPAAPVLTLARGSDRK